MLPGKAPMVGSDATFGKPAFLHAVGKMPRDSFRKPTGVDKYQGRAMFRNKISKAIIDLIPNFSRHDRLKGRRWQFDGKISVTGDPDSSKTVAEVAAYAYVPVPLPKGLTPGLSEEAFWEPENNTYPFGCHISLLEIDRDTGEPT